MRVAASAVVLGVGTALAGALVVWEVEVALSGLTFDPLGRVFGIFDAGKIKKQIKKQADVTMNSSVSDDEEKKTQRPKKKEKKTNLKLWRDSSDLLC